MAMGSRVGVFYRARVAAWYIAALFIAGPAMAGPPFRQTIPSRSSISTTSSTRFPREPVCSAKRRAYCRLLNTIMASANAHFHIIVPAVAFDAATGTNTISAPAIRSLA